MKRILLGGLLTATTLAGGLAFTSEVSATSGSSTQCEVDEAAAVLEGESIQDPPVDCHKVWVCHAVAGKGEGIDPDETDGEGELKNGYNLIYVDVASTEPDGGKGANDHYGHSFDAPKRNKKFGDAPDYLLYDYILGPVKPAILPGKCGAKPTPNVEVTPSVKYTAPTCGAAGSAVLSTDEGYTWRDNKNGTWTAVADEGYFIEGQDTFGPYETAKLTGEVACPTLIPPPPAPPAQIQVASNAPILPPAAAAPAAPAAAVSAVPTQLPSTGSSSWALALVALVTLLGGTGLVRLSRRSNI